MRYYLNVILSILLISGSLGAAENFEVEKNIKKEIQVTAANTYTNEKQEGNSAIKAKDFVIKEGAELRVYGDGIEKAKNVRGIYVEGNRFSSKMEIQKGAKVFVDITSNTEEESLSTQELDRSIGGFKNRPVEGMYVKHMSKAFEIRKGGELNIKTYDNQLLKAQKKVSEGKKADEEHDETDLFHQLLRKSAALSMGAALVNSGTINIESSGIGIKNGDYEDKKMDFKEGSETNIKAGLIAIGAGKSKVTFEKGSKANLISGAYGLIAKQAEFKEGSKVRAMGKYALGNYDYKGNGDKYIFEKGSEIDLFANEAGLYALNLGGSSKVYARGKNIVETCNTRERSEGFTFEKGSILEGNIKNSYDAHLIMEEGVKLFVNNQMEAKMDFKGELYAGPREAYEEIERKSYAETAEDMDATAGASVLLLGKLKEQQIDTLGGATPYRNPPPNNYYTVDVNREKANTTKESMLNLENAKLHLRVGGMFSEDSKQNDMLLFSKRARVKGKAEMILHPTNISGIQRNMVFHLLEEEKKNGEYDLEKLSLNLPDTELGPLVFTREDKKLADKYIISLRDTGKLSKSAISSMNFARDSYEWNKKELQEIQQKIFVKKDVEVGENFWILSSQENFTNKETRRKWKENNLYAGYDHTFGPRLSLGFFAGKSAGGINSTAQGVYIQKDFDSFYMGTLVKITAIKQEKKRNHSSDISFMIGHQWDNKSNVYTDNRLMITRGHMSSHQYTEGNGMITQREKFNYVDGEFRSRIGYGFNSGSIFAEVGLGKHILGKQRILWNGKVQEELKHDGLDKKIGVGGEWKFRQHKIDMKISKEYSRYYKSDIKMSFGYSYKF